MCSYQHPLMCVIVFGHRHVVPWAGTWECRHLENGSRKSKVQKIKTVVSDPSLVLVSSFTSKQSRSPTQVKASYKGVGGGTRAVW